MKNIQLVLFSTLVSPIFKSIMLLLIELEDLDQFVGGKEETDG